MSLAVGLECVVLIVMAGQRLTMNARSGYVTDFWHPTGLLEPRRAVRPVVMWWSAYLDQGGFSRDYRVGYLDETVHTALVFVHPAPDTPPRS